MKLIRYTAPLDAGLLPDAPRVHALLLDHAPEAGVASSAVFLLDTGDRKWKNARDRGRLRENGWAASFLSEYPKLGSISYGDPKLNSKRFVQAGLLPDAPRVQALLLDHAPEAGVASSAVFLLDTGDRKWKNARDRGRLRENGWAARF
ncbi:hypothetical protein QYE76_064653 [Lolium multiflorum]|uniref:Uncharacterized protein n=1 Tax=Lolium multiflorum TaxID=4521 RepID=A0AAD8W847_LOLMU|nr:hypothetical protein QYE76_064653 [Lolium multiflorum]